MRRPASLTLAALLLTGAACGEMNIEHGNDDAAAEAEPSAPAEILSPEKILQGEDLTSIDLSTMTREEMAKILDPDTACVFVFTEVGFPALAIAPEGGGVAKLDGGLVALSGGTDLSSPTLQAPTFVSSYGRTTMTAKRVSKACASGRPTLS